MRYKDFKIRIEGKRGDAYNVSVESPAGNSEENIVFDFDVAGISGQILQLGRTVRGAARDVEIDITDGPSPAEIGEMLFRTLFTGSIAKMYYQSYRDLKDPDAGLRIKLHLNLNDPDVSALAAVPWEYIREAANMEYLILSRQTPLVRYLDVQRPNSVQPLEDVLRILVVMASPKGVHKLDLDAEKKLIENSWASDPGVSVDFLTHATAEKLLQQLSRKQYHVLHYMGHGAHDPKTGMGGLVLEDDAGDVAIMDSETLGQLLRNEPTLRLVFLNACDTARTDELRPFAGVTNRLVMAGVPAVVAMQFPISDAAAISFAKAFYGSLVSGAPVDEATSFGRMAIMVNEPKSLEWGTPVLCMRSPDGRLFELAGSAAAVTPDVTVTPGGAGAIPPSATPTADAGSPGGSRLKLGLGIGGAIAATIAAFLIVPMFLGGDSGDFRWDPPQPVLDVGVPEKIRLQLVTVNKDGEESIRPYSRSYEVKVRPDGANLLPLKRTSESDWEWETTATNLGAAALIATIAKRSGDGAKEDPEQLTLPIEVKVGTKIQATFDAALGAVKETGKSTDDVLSALETVSKKPEILSAEMRTTLKDELTAVTTLRDMERAAAAMAADNTSTLTEKLTALTAWSEQFRDVRYDPGRDDGLALYRSLTELKAHANIERVVLCGSYNKCTDSVPGIKASSPLWVSTVPAASNLDCNIEGPDSKSCTVGKTYRTVNKPGAHTVVIRNEHGDLLARQTVEIY